MLRSFYLASIHKVSFSQDLAAKKRHTYIQYENLLKMNNFT